MSPISTRICVPNLVAVGRSCRKKMGGTDRQTKKTAALYSRCLMWVQMIGSRILQHTHVEEINLYFQAGYGLLFCSLGSRLLRSMLMEIHLFSEIDLK